MTTLRDLLNNFAHDLLTFPIEPVSGQSLKEARQEKIDELLEEYIETIKERLIG